MNRLFAMLLLVCCAVPVIAQSAPTAPVSERGVYAVINASGAKDNLSGFSTQLSTAVGYDLSRALWVETGISYYPLVSTEATTSTGTTKTNVSNELGDAYCTLGYGSKFESLSYVGSLQGTAPTGSSSAGVSTGRATWHSNNHVEADFGRVSPYVEAGIGNSLQDTKKYHRAYTTLGYVVPAAAGLNFDLGHKLSFDASTYYDLPFGDQKLYSRMVGRSAASVMAGRGRRPITTQAYAQGGAILAEDHGYNGSLSFNATKRATLEVSYNRSIPDALDTVTATLSYRFGHLRGAAPQKAQ
ncbi:MAG TPA: hypothetical protein VF786_06835 [Terriglobales bacterium]